MQFRTTGLWSEVWVLCSLLLMIALEQQPAAASSGLKVERGSATVVLGSLGDVATVWRREHWFYSFDSSWFPWRVNILWEWGSYAAGRACMCGWSWICWCCCRESWLFVWFAMSAEFAEDPRVVTWVCWGLAACMLESSCIREMIKDYNFTLKAHS